MTDAELLTSISSIINQAIDRLKEEKILQKPKKSAYAKTEQLLYNYRGFQRVVKEKQEQIEEIKKYGVSHKGSAVHTYCGDNTVHGLSTVEETVDDAVHTVQKSVQEIVNVINMINKAMEFIRNDPYYKTLEMRYLDGMGQEDIAKQFGCTPQNISYHKSRLIKELALRLFPNEVAKEMLE